METHSRVTAILEKDLAAGFALTGMEVIRVRDQSEFRDTLMNVADSREYGVVIVEERMLDALDERSRKSIDSMNVPLVIAVPGELRWKPFESLPEDDAVSNLIRSAIGYKVDIGRRS